LYDIRYSQYDSIGYFFKVNSFTIDEENNEPVFNTSVENVYDTVFYRQSSNTSNYYTYLEIPVYAGINVFSQKKFSVYLKTGFSYSILLDDYETAPDYENDLATWIYIVNKTPVRNKSFWQLSAGVGLYYQFNNSLILGLEPVYQYYLKSVYEQRYNQKSPYSFGLRTGIFYKF
jgi:hypothetical protein